MGARSGTGDTPRRRFRSGRQQAAAWPVPQRSGSRRRRSRLDLGSSWIQQRAFRSPATANTRAAAANAGTAPDLSTALRSAPRSGVIAGPSAATGDTAAEGDAPAAVPAESGAAAPAAAPAKGVAAAGGGCAAAAAPGPR